MRGEIHEQRLLEGARAGKLIAEFLTLLARGHQAEQLQCVSENAKSKNTNEGGEDEVLGRQVGCLVGC